MLLSLFFLGACDKNDEIIPEDADENFITSVVMTVDGKSYTADITDNTVTITVPYTVSLNNAFLAASSFCARSSGGSASSLRMMPA